MNEALNLKLGHNQTTYKLVRDIPFTMKHVNYGISKGMYHHERRAIVPIRISETSFMIDARGSNESNIKTIGW